MFRNKSVDVHRFAMVPRADIPRSAFRMQRGCKTTFNSGFLVPCMPPMEVLPGDTFKLKATFFARMATPIKPVMDNLFLESFFFFVPCRLLWTNWVKFMGEQKQPGDSIAFTIPTGTSPVGGWGLLTLADYFGIPVAGQVGAGNTITVNALPFRAYQLIFNEWFRDENLMAAYTVPTGDGPDTLPTGLSRRGKRHDYFTGCLPFLQKGTAVTLPLGASAPVKTQSTATVSGAAAALKWAVASTGVTVTTQNGLGTAVTTGETQLSGGGAAGGSVLYPNNLFADLSAATAATINQIRQAFQIQKVLERDARGGTRYTEIIFAHFGVKSPDARLQRPEYLGGGSTPISVNPIAQTANTPVSGTPQGNLSAFATGLGNHGFAQSFTEHGYIIGLINVRADLSYQQGLEVLWNRRTRYDFYLPAFAMLGEQAVMNREIFCDGSANDANVFGYQERWAELRYLPSKITGLFRSTSTGTLDIWHLSQKFAALPTLNETFISDTPPVARVIATPTEPEFILDSFFDVFAARPLPLYSVPGLIDHF